MPLRCGYGPPRPAPPPDGRGPFWQAVLRRFDLERALCFVKQTLGWTRPKLRTPEAADRRTRVLIAAHTQLRLDRPLGRGPRPRPWEKPTTDRLTLSPIRRGFRNIHTHLACPTRVPRPRGASPGRPPGAKYKHPGTPLRRRQDRQTPRYPQGHRQARKILVGRRPSSGTEELDDLAHPADREGGPPRRWRQPEDRALSHPGSPSRCNALASDNFATRSVTRAGLALL